MAIGQIHSNDYTYEHVAQCEGVDYEVHQHARGDGHWYITYSSGPHKHYPMGEIDGYATRDKAVSAASRYASP